MLRRSTLAALVVCLFAVLPSVALAGKKPMSSASTASISLITADPHLGGYVSFSSIAPSSVKSPRIAVRCYQNGVMTYAEAAPADQSFLLGGGGSEWKTAGGDADCTAELFWINWAGQTQQFNTLATTAFHAAG